MVLVIDHIHVHDRLRDIRLKSVLQTKLRFSVKIRTNTGGWQHCPRRVQRAQLRVRPTHAEAQEHTPAEMYPATIVEELE